MVVAVLVAAFVALYPYLEVAGYCGDGGCPEIVQISASSSPELPTAGVLTSLVAAATIPAATMRRSHSDRRPEEIRISPETPPPRL